MLEPVRFDDLFTADLVVDRVYEGGRRGNAGDDPIARLLPVGNQGGFRFKLLKGRPAVLVLYTSGADPDWPDYLDPVTGDFTYFGDNKAPGSELLDTRRGGNRILDNMFSWSRTSPEDRAKVAPTFLFEKAGHYRDVIFRGLLAPGSPRLTAEEELVAIWRTTRDRRFQNYRSHFTVLDIPVIPRAWLNDLLVGETISSHTPENWRRWVRGRLYAPLQAPRTTKVRTQAEQEPSSDAERALLSAIHAHFEGRPTDFEALAAHLWLMSDENVISVDITRPSRDGGRDAEGKYKIGPASDPISVDFALEAKCYRPGHGVGAKEVSRLISRLKRTDFGVLVTTSHITSQIYREVRDDRHPVIFITGADIVVILRQLGLRTEPDLIAWLTERYPEPEPSVDLSDRLPVEISEYEHSAPSDNSEAVAELDAAETATS